MGGEECVICFEVSGITGRYGCPCTASVCLDCFVKGDPRCPVCRFVDPKHGCLICGDYTLDLFCAFHMNYIVRKYLPHILFILFLLIVIAVGSTISLVYRAWELYSFE